MTSSPPRTPREQRRHAVTHNGIVLVVPLLAWNAAMWPRLPAGAGGTASVPLLLEITEQCLRVAVFAMPLWLRLEYRGTRGCCGWLLYGLGLLTYTLTWIPWLRGVEQEHLLLLLGPTVSPLVLFAGIAVLGRSAAYGLVAAGFTLVHALRVAVQSGVL